MNDRRSGRTPGVWRALGPIAPLVVLGLGVGGCIEPNIDHCAFGYGDASCPEERPYCVVASDPRSHTGLVNGCSALRSRSLEGDPSGNGFIDVPYGLPTAIKARSGRPRDPRALQAVLIEHGYPQECIAPAVLEQRFEPLLPDVRAVREHLEKRDEHGRSRLEIKGPLDAKLRAFGADVDLWVSECSELVAGTTGETTSSGTDETSTSTSGSSSGSSSGGGGCLADTDCLDPFAPYCDPATASCVACSTQPDPDGFCASIDPLHPVCVGAECVACADGETQACDDQLLVCDTTTNTCVPCTEHDQCDAGACDLLLDLPTCFEPENVLDVGAEQPYPTITDALNAVDDQQLERAVLRLSGEIYNEFTLIDNRAIAIISADRTPPSLEGTGVFNEPTLMVNDSDARVYLNDVFVSNPSSSAFGIFCVDGALDIRRSRIVMSPGGDIYTDSLCELHIRNSFLGGNESNVDVITINNASLDMVYTTVNAGLGTARALYCTAGSDVAVRNSILVSREANDLDCPSGVFTNNATNQDASGSNVPVGGWNSAWFSSYSVGDFHLTLQGEITFAGIAIWQLGDPPADIDGDPRPSRDNSPDRPGADAP